MAKCIASNSLGAAPDTYLYALAHCTAGNVKTLATIGSDDTLRLFDPNLKLSQATSSCHAGVTCLTSSDDNSNNVQFLTGGRDGLVRCWDPRSRGHIAQASDPRGNGIASLASRDRFIAVGTESLKEGLGDVSVLLYDTRNFTAPIRQYEESHTDTITQLVFHPTQPNLLLSGSTDGLASIFDVEQTDEEDALQQVLNPRSAVHCAGFIAEDQVYVVSTDEQYSIHTLAKTLSEDEEVPPPIQFGDMRERLQCTYVIDVVLQSSGGPPLIAHGNAESGKLSLTSLGSPGSWALGQSLDLPDAHGSEIVRGVLLDAGLTYTCGEDGTVKVWNVGQ
jgi:WD40 repeat protein